MFEILVAIVIGCFLGVLAGLLPGMHPNNLIPMLSGAMFFLDPLSASVILISAGVVNSLVSFLPSVFLGATEENNVLSVLPGHRLLLEGRGYEAVKLATIGGLGAVFFITLTLPLFSIVMPQLYSLMRPKIHLLLILAMAFLLMKEKRKIHALFVFLLSGVFGYFALRLGSFALFPMLSGLFGLPLIMLSIKDQVKLPETVEREEGVDKKNVAGGVGLGAIAGIIAGLLPGLGSTQSMLIAEEAASGREGIPAKKFMVALGAVSMADVIYSLFSIWLIGNPRSGIAVAVDSLMKVGQKEALLFLSVVFVASAIGAAISLLLSKKMLNFLKIIEYKKLCIFVLLFVAFSVMLFSGLVGLAIMAIAVCIGMLPNLLGVRRTNCMGCLIVPTIVFFATL